MNAFLKALFFVFISEMGDKTQVVSFSLGAQYNLFNVLVGVFLGIVAMMTMTVGAGHLAGQFLPIFWINIASGLLFIGFGIWALKEESGGEEKKEVGKGFGPIVAIATTFFIAELGDKTVLASLAVASQEHQYFPVWAGSVLGMFLADLLAIVLGRVVGKRLPDKVIRYGSAAIFVIAGVYTIVDAFLH
jgi:putative Ca2+/H+ antiporter (TMEM165/GDT1 family)